MGILYQVFRLTRVANHEPGKAEEVIAPTDVAEPDLLASQLFGAAAHYLYRLVAARFG